MPKLSIVIPVFNEQDVIKECICRLENVINALDLDYELIFVNDGSTDQTFDLLKAAKQHNNRLKIISLSRNFGHQNALSAGIDLAAGEAIVTLDADLQDPPELIPQLVDKWRQSYQIVHARRTNRAGETIFKKWTAHIYYRLINALSGTTMPVDVGDFRLLDRCAVEDLKKMNERHRYIRGMVGWLGYRQAFVDYDRSSRPAGATKFSLARMMRFSMDGIISFSVVPLRLSTMLGLLCACLAGAYALYALWQKIVLNMVVQGWTSVIMVVVFIGGIQLLCLGILGEYLAIMYDELKKRPLYIVARID